jgi:hypothetical protein
LTCRIENLKGNWLRRSVESASEVMEESLAAASRVREAAARSGRWFRALGGKESSDSEPPGGDGHSLPKAKPPLKQKNPRDSGWLSVVLC